jgi:hypothetical protein
VLALNQANFFIDAFNINGANGGEPTKYEVYAKLIVKGKEKMPGD